MANYDYIAGKERVLEILQNPNETEDVQKIPSESAFSYDNGYYGWVTALFIDICDSTALFAASRVRPTTVAKVIRAFVSELIEILRRDENLREIGIRGDCVYAIYTCSSSKDDYEVFDKAVFANTFLKMLNGLLKQNNIPVEVKAGIGLASSKTLVVKTGRKATGINDFVWIGKSVAFASHLASMANRSGKTPILMTKFYYDGIKKHAHIYDSDNWSDEWFDQYENNKMGPLFGCNVVKTAFNKWVTGGMKTND